MSSSVKIMIFVIVGFVLFLGAVAALLWFFRDRLVPGRAEEDGEEPEEEPVRPAEETRRAFRNTERRSFSGSAAPSRPLSEESASGYDEDDEDDDFALPKAPDSREEEPKTAHLDDILDCIYLVGRTLSECGIPESCVSDDGTELLVDGGLFGAFAYGGLPLVSEASKEPVMDSFYAVTKDAGMDTLKEQLEARFGAPVSEGEEPYEDGSEGGTEYAAFSTDFGMLWLSRGTGHDYVNLNLTREN